MKYPTSAEKEALTVQLLSTGKQLDIHVNPAVSGTILPEYLLKELTIKLNIGLNMAIPIPDLVVDSSGIYATLVFQKQPVTTELPWESIWAVAYSGSESGWILGERPLAKEKVRPSYLRLVK